MIAYADTGFVISLFLEETTSDAADRAFAAVDGPVQLSILSRLEMRNALNLSIARRRITQAERDAAWQAFEAQVTAGAFVLQDVDAQALFLKGYELSDRHTPLHATRSLDLLHVAEAEGLAVRP